MTGTTPHLNQLAALTARVGNLHEQLAILGEQHADARRELARAEKDLAEGGGDDAADRVNRLRARLKGERGKEIDVAVQAKEKQLRAEHTDAQREADSYRRHHAGDLADELMPSALQARDDLVTAWHTFQQACSRWDAAARAFTPLVLAREDLGLKDVPDNPMRDALQFGKNAVSALDRNPHEGVPAPWQAVPDSDIRWPATERGTVHAGGAHRDAASLRAARDQFHPA